MFSAIRERLSGLVGGSQPDRIEWCVFEMQNSELRPGTWHTTVCLVPEVVDGVRLSFRTSPLLRNGSGHDVLAGLPDDLQELAGLLKQMTLTEAARHLGIATTTLSYRLGKLRHHFAAAGFGHDDNYFLYS